jgi:hypothetical protein
VGFLGGLFAGIVKGPGRRVGTVGIHAEAAENLAEGQGGVRRGAFRGGAHPVIIPDQAFLGVKKLLPILFLPGFVEVDPFKIIVRPGFHAPIIPQPRRKTTPRTPG